MDAPQNTRRLLIKIAYMGGAYTGWQVQPKGQSIQSLLERAIHPIAGQATRLHGSGRTDAGVHARGQYAHFDLPASCRIQAAQVVPALNTQLPGDVRVMQAWELDADFHARFSAQSKHYEYLWACSRVLEPRLFGRAWHLPYSLDLERMQQACHRLRGRHDFIGLCARRGNEPEPLPKDYFVRRIDSAAITTEGDSWRLDIQGEGFLYRMVRFIAGALVDIGRGKLSLQGWQALLAGDPKAWPHPRCAPAEGLSLVEVHYPADSLR